MTTPIILHPYQKEVVDRFRRKAEGDAFYKLVLTLWGEGWRPALRALLAEHGHRYTPNAARNTFLFWRKGERRVPEWAGVILGAEEARRLQQASSSRGVDL